MVDRNGFITDEEPAAFRAAGYDDKAAIEVIAAITNRQVAGIETVFIVTGESFAYTSSSLIKQIAALGGSLDALATLVPPAVVEALRAKRRDPSNPIGKLARDGLVE